MRSEALVVTVGDSVVGVEAALVAGQLACPGCGAVLAPWGWARARVVRSVGSAIRLRPRRGRCVACGASHVLLPVSLLVRRADAVEVVGAGLVMKAAGFGWRRVAERLGRPGATVRGWLRRFAARAEAVRGLFTALLVTLAPDPVPAASAGSVFADAVVAVIAASAGAGARWMEVVGLSPWRLASSVSGSRLLAPGWPQVSINTSCP